MSIFNIKCNAYAVLCLIFAILIAPACFYKRCYIFSVKSCPHHPHAFTVTPIHQVTFYIQLYLFWSKRAALWNNHFPVRSVKIAPFNEPVVLLPMFTHIGPIDMAFGYIYGDAIRRSTTLIQNSFYIRPIRAKRQNPGMCSIKYKQSSIFFVSVFHYNYLLSAFMI